METDDLAHTKDLLLQDTMKSVITQKELMVQPDPSKISYGRVIK